MARKWLSSYLENRKQYVCFNGSDSGFLSISCGVPQGSIRGPSLLLLCNVSTRLTSILFADDTSCISEGTDLAKSESESEMYLFDPHKKCIQSNNEHI